MLFSVAEIMILCLLADWLCRKAHLPGLLGMLMIGVMLGPHVLGWLTPDLLAISADLRLLALLVILLRAGLKLSRTTLHRAGGRVILLAFIPATLEFACITLVAPLLLPLTYIESALLGTVVAAVSPAVVVPAMIRLLEERRGTAKSIPSMIMAAASMDDVYIVVLHTIVLSTYLGTGDNLIQQLAAIPISLISGIAAGLLAGFGMYRLFDHFNPRATKRALLLIAAAALLIRLQHLTQGVFPFAGLVATMAIGYTFLEKREVMAHELSAKLAKIWIFAEIILFSMIGAQVNVSVAWQAGIASAVAIAAGLLVRAAGVWLCLLGSPLCPRERFFVMISFCPKATVQAAIGAGPLLAMRQAGLPTGPGEMILAVAVLSIVLTAPLGAWAISFTGKRFLTVSPPPTEKTN